MDATGLVLGKLAQRIAVTLQGKYKPTYYPTVDCGDYVVVTNCREIRVTGDKWTEKRYYHHNRRPGGLIVRTMRDVFLKDPCEILRRAVWGMLPRNKTRLARMERLKLFADAQHPHEMQIYRQYSPKFDGDTRFLRVPHSNVVNF